MAVCIIELCSVTPSDESEVRRTPELVFLKEMTRGKVGYLESSCGDRDQEGKRHSPWLPWSPYSEGMGVRYVMDAVVLH